MMKVLFQVGLIVGAVGCATDGESLGPPYELSVIATGLSAGTNLHIGVTDASGNKLIRDEWSPTSSADAHVTYNSLLATSVSYTVYVYADLDGNNQCDSTDRVWVATLGPITASAIVDLSVLEQQPAACSYFRS